MRLGIVGAEGAKFTPRGEQRARAAIRNALRVNRVSLVVSGKCHLGGIDIWAVEEAYALGILYKEFAPADLHWETGYKPRNVLIAHESEKVVSIVVRTLPPGFTGMTHKLCYHCKRDDHVKSGGCWTMHYAAKLGKATQLIII